MATQHVLTAAAAGLFLVGLVLLAPPGLLRPARHAFTPRNTHYSWVIKGAPLPGETADAASFGGGGFQYMHMAMMERLPNGGGGVPGVAHLLRGIRALGGAVHAESS